VRIHWVQKVIVVGARKGGIKDQSLSYLVS
jgi:hypothetical protein